MTGFDIPPQANAIRSWLEQHSSRDHTAEVIEKLKQRTLSTDASSEDSIDPFSKSLDPQLWPWNFAANNLVKQGAYSDALNVWSALYLAILRLQSITQCRFHKGMALCNIGYALDKVTEYRKWGQSAWLLGIVEDAISNPGTVLEAKNYTNAVATGMPKSLLIQLVRTVESRISDLGIVPSYPELVIGIWQSPTRIGAPSTYLETIQRFNRKLDNNEWPSDGNYWKFVSEELWLMNGGSK